MLEMPLVLDPEQIIKAYRDLISGRDAQGTDAMRAEWEQVAERLRAMWEHWNGADSLHDAAFGADSTTPPDAN